MEITALINELLQALENRFEKRVCFVGLQGSYARGEATEESDVDVVVILDKLSASDVETYRSLLDSLSHREKMCGFLCGKNELLHWEPSDLVSLYYDTHPLKGSLEEWMPFVKEEAANRAIKIGACNVYHGCVHNMLYGRSEEALKGLYKAASFVLRTIAYQKNNGHPIGCQKELFSSLSLDDQQILHTFTRLKNGGTIEFQKMSEALLIRAKRWIESTP